MPTVPHWKCGHPWLMTDGQEHRTPVQPYTLSVLQISASGGGKKTYAKALSARLSHSQSSDIVAELESIRI